MSVIKKPWGTVEGNDVYLFEMKNANGVTVCVSNYGGAIVSLIVPDKDGNMRDVVLGFDSLDGYLVNKPFLGVLVGRVANRIGSARFTLDGKEYKLEANDGANHLHGGSRGFNTKVWDVSQYEDSHVVLTHYSPDGDSGYPGDVTAVVTYTLTDSNAFRISYRAETTGKTICNLTNHSYFNLNGQNSGEIYKHELQINADFVTAVGDDLIPTGVLKPVRGTAYDFNTPKLIGCDIGNVGLGYDDNFVITSREDNIAAVAYSPESGIRMTVKTNNPGIQLYTGNFLDGTAIGKNGVPVTKHSAFCLETQFFPDSINQPAFTPCILEKGKPQEFFTEFTFGVK